MPTRIQTYVFVYITFGVWSLLALYHGVTVKANWFSILSVAAAVVFGILIAFDKWLWEWRWFKSWLVKRPHLRGTWRAVLKSNYRDPTSRQAIDPIWAFMQIRQTYSRITLRLMTSESCSDVIAVDLRDTETGCYSLASVYQNTPRLVVRDRSEIHFGALLLTIPEGEEQVLSGQYWTDRDTRGEIELSERRKKLYSTYKTALKAFGESEAS